MNNKLKSMIISFSFIIILIGFMGSGILLKDRDISNEERRKLSQMPAFTVEKLMSGEYFQDMESYLLDQFPLRENLRKIKSFVSTKIFKQKDNNNIYTVNGSIFKMEYPLNETSIYNSAKFYNEIAEKYFKNSNVYYTVVPDKNYFVKGDYLKLDYKKLIDIMKNNTKNMKYIDITGDLDIDDYYNTDLHWKQEDLINVANKILTSMGEKVLDNNYKEKTFDNFHGAYYGQSATNIKPDKLTYLTNDTIENCKVYDYEMQEYMKVYNDEDFNNVDSYDIYLGGDKSLLTIENPSNTSGKELYIFRDSFGSSLSPLLVENYSKVTLVDMRYMSADQFEKFVHVKYNSDVLFMYNTLILNNSGVISKFLL